MDCVGLVPAELFLLKALLRLSLDLDCHSHSDLPRRSSVVGIFESKMSVSSTLSVSG